MKIAVVGNTKQTLKGLSRLIEEKYNVVYVHGLSSEKAKSKVNSVCLREFCNTHNIVLDKSNDWNNLLNLEVDLIICLGDSRIVPSKVLSKQNVIGNHGAILPFVQGGASYVWGRMLNTGKWGVSIMELGEIVDSGKILATKEFLYEPDCNMEVFCDAADNATVELLFEYLDGKHTPTENSKWNVKIARHTDTKFVTDMLRCTLEEGKNIYLPPRRPIDSILKDGWGEKFTKLFKIANNKPYPRWYK
jgi:methionyl-tRNA formyltransferase